jgi:hypothetical protein
MALVTSQQISKYYSIYKNIDVTFTKQVIEATGLQTKKVYIKCLGEQWPCVVYSSSMTSAKVIANLKPENFETIRKANNMISLRFSFLQPDKVDPVAFFVTSKITGYNPYNPENPNLNYVSLDYTQRPPDDLIEILGQLLEANVNAKKRKEERILLTPDAIRKLGLKSKEIEVLIESVPRKGILRDLSFSGAKFIVVGVAKFLVDKEAAIRITLEEKNKILTLKGKIIRNEPVEGRKDLAALVIYFDENSIPMEYKMKLNDYLTHTRKTATEQGGEKE